MRYNEFEKAMIEALVDFGKNFDKEEVKLRGLERLIMEHPHWFANEIITAMVNWSGSELFDGAESELLGEDDDNE